MAIFSRKMEKDEMRTQALLELCTKKESEHHGDDYKYMLQVLKTAQKEPQRLTMQPVILYTYCIEMMMANKKNFSSENYTEALEYGEQVYRGMFIYEDSTPDKETLMLVMTEMFDEDSVIAKRCFNPDIFHLFTNKHNYIKWIRSLRKYSHLEKYNASFLEYGAVARSYFLDEDMFTAAMIHYALRLVKMADIAYVFEDEMKKLTHMVGVYDVDEERILGIERKMDQADVALARLTDTVAASKEMCTVLDSKTKEALSELTKLRESETMLLQSKVEAAEQTIRDTFKEIREEQKKDVLYEKNKLLKEVFEDAESRLKELEKNGRSLVDATALEIMQLQQDTKKLLTRLDNTLANEEKMKILLTKSEESDELMKKVEKLMLLDQRSIDHVVQKVGDEASFKGTENAASAKGTGKGASGQGQTGNGQAAAQQAQNGTGSDRIIVVPTEEIAIQNDIMRPVNYVFDDHVSFADKKKRVMERKAKLMENGEYFHSAFDDVLTAVMENANPYLIGPSGCGKTYMVEQMARLLDVDFIDIGYINEEYDILGFQTANGGYSRPNFYRCYKYGMMAFCDELDNGNARATVKLNSFLSNSENASYSFPNGERVMRHPNFRLIAAGNTTGNGADSNYNTREKIEESVQQRMMPITIGYDNEVEKRILKDYKEWYGLIVLFRKATDAWSKGSYSDASGIITTRDAAKIKKYLQHGSFTEEKIINYEFIQTKDKSYLAFLSEFMKKNALQGKDSVRLANMFCNQADRILKE